ncbi:MAG: TPM domain-containing protein [Deltaproteobacteria bacterium]|nr:TPM domain-containing protein [Deltaproteobacteria bacterium]
MKNVLSDEERKKLDRRIAEAEKRTGAQIVLAVIGRSDAYPDLPWKAFALGASLAGLVVFIAGILRPPASSAVAALLSVVAILSAGAGLTLLCVLIPPVARLFLSLQRAEAETRQYAESLFLSRQMFAAADRRAVLILIGLFERRIVILPDTGLADQLQAGATGRVIDGMRAHLRAGRLAKALEAGLESLEALIRREGPSPGPSCAPANDLPNAVIEEKGV